MKAKEFVKRNFTDDGFDHLDRGHLVSIFQDLEPLFKMAKEDDIVLI